VFVRKSYVFVIPAIFCVGISVLQAQDSGTPLRSDRNGWFPGQTLLSVCPCIIQFMNYQ